MEFNTTVMGSSSNLKGKIAPAISGQYTVKEAIDALIAGSGLEARRSPSGGFMVTPKVTSAGTGAEQKGKQASSAEATPQSDTKTHYLEPMMVVGESEGTNNVTLEDLQKREPQDLSELFSRSPSVDAGGGNPQVQKLYIRNMEDTTMNVSVDGARQTGILFHHQGRLHRPGVAAQS